MYIEATLLKGLKKIIEDFELYPEDNNEPNRVLRIKWWQTMIILRMIPLKLED